MSNESLEEGRSMLSGDDEEEAVIETAKISRIIDDRPVDDDDVRAKSDSRSRNPQLPLRMAQPAVQRSSVISTAIRDVQIGMTSPPQFHLQPPSGRLAGNPALGAPRLESPMDRSYMPPPLSPRRPISPIPLSQHAPDPSATDRLEEPTRAGHRRANSTESISWLDTIDESGGSSCSSSVHSLSPRGLRRKHIRNGSGATEAEFDAALDAAVEAAYDEGYEPYDDGMPNSAELRANRARNVELAKERVREAEREEAIATAKYRYRETQLRNEPLPHVRESAELNFHDEAEEEERLLDEITREYMLDGFDFDLQTKSSLPRQSDSSGFSGSTYNSSVSSHRTTGGTSLSTVAELSQPPKPKAPISSPPTVSASSGTLASVSEARTADGNDASETNPKAQVIAKDATASVRSRRLSGQNPKTLKIETSLPPVPPAPHTDKASHIEREVLPEVPPLPKTAAAATFSSAQPMVDANFKVPTSLPSHSQNGLNAPSPQALGQISADTAYAVSPAALALNNAMSNDSLTAPASPKTGKGPSIGIRKNKSSLSLKQRNLSVSSPDGSDGSVATPMSATFNLGGRKAGIAPIPTPTPSVPTFNVDGLPSGGMHLFESDIHSPYSPGSPSATVTNAPIPLEPCPESYLLRPFWLMRCFYQTIVHPRGGYLSTKLFIPRDVWRVKGVKLKNVDDKIANCDLLTAALQRLSTVDTLDADAVLEEMQAFEVVLDQVQTQLTKKLGNEVGMQGVSVLFKDAYTVGVGSAADGNPEKGSHGSQDHGTKSGLSQSKSYLTSWRKLRSKNSAVGLSNMAGPKGVTPEVSKDSLTMATLPMTSLPNIRFAKRDVSGVVFEGPNGGYMSSLAKLFDSVQILGTPATPHLPS